MSALTTQDLTQVVKETIRQVQQTCGRACPELTDRLRPVGDLEAFDSLLGLEATRLLELRLGRKLPETVFVASNGKYALSLRGIAKRVQRCLADEEKA